MQIEAIQLGCDSRIREVEKEVASLRRDASQASSIHKQATASWQIKLDHQLAEAIFYNTNEIWIILTQFTKGTQIQLESFNL